MLFEVRPDWAEEVRGGPFDPFYDDGKLDAFYEWLFTKYQQEANEQER